MYIGLRPRILKRSQVLSTILVADIMLLILFLMQRARSIALVLKTFELAQMHASKKAKYFLYFNRWIWKNKISNVTTADLLNYIYEKKMERRGKR